MNKNSFLLNAITLWTIIFFISLGLYCASSNGYLPLVHGPYYFSIAQSLFYNGEINFYAIYPPVQTMVYTLQIGISYLEYLIFFISEKYWYQIFYAITSLAWIIAINEFLKFESKDIQKIDKYILSFIFFLQPYNLNQLANFSNEAFYIPILIYFYFSFYRYTTSEKKNYFYIILFSLFIILGVFFRLHHVVLCINFFIFSLYLKNKKIIFGLIFIGLINIIFFAITIYFTELDKVFIDHFNYTNKNVIVGSNDFLFSNIFFYLEKFFKILSYPILLSKFTENQTITYIFGIFFLSLILYSYFSLQKNNKDFNFFNLSYLILSIIFVLWLPPFEYSYILPFSFLLLFYCFIGFKKIFKDYYTKAFIILFIIMSTLTTTNYFFLGQKYVEGFEYRKFIKDIKSNYPKKYDMDKNIYYISDDLFDHIEDFYWQQINKRPFCQLIVKIEECAKVQEVDANWNSIIIIGKSPLNLTDYGVDQSKFKTGEGINKNKLLEIIKIVSVKLKLSEFEAEFKEYYQGNYFFHFEYKRLIELD